MEAGAAAGEEDDDGGDEVADGGDEQGPDGGAELGGGARARVVDGALEDGEADEVGDEDDEGDDEGEQADQGGQERADHAGAQGEQEGDEGQAGRHGVQHHDVGQAVGRVRAPVGGVEGAARGGAQDVGGLVADVAARALVIAAGLLHAVAKGAECDVGVVLVVVLWQDDL